MPEPPAPAIGRVRSTSPAPGISAAELYARHARPHSPLTAGKLERWLLAEGLATNGDGLLHPTRLAVEIAYALEWPAS